MDPSLVTDRLRTHVKHIDGVFSMFVIDRLMKEPSVFISHGMFWPFAVEPNLDPLLPSEEDLSFYIQG